MKDSGVIILKKHRLLIKIKDFLVDNKRKAKKKQPVGCKAFISLEKW